MSLFWERPVSLVLSILLLMIIAVPVTLSLMNRAKGKTLAAPVFASGKYTLFAGENVAEKVLLKGAAPK